MKPAVILATVALLVFAWMFRYEVTLGGPAQLILRLDRWTGDVYAFNPTYEKWERLDGGPPAVDLLQKPAEK